MTKVKFLLSILKHFLTQKFYKGSFNLTEGVETNGGGPHVAFKPLLMHII
jgi:hypothetical protein